MPAPTIYDTRTLLGVVEKIETFVPFLLTLFFPRLVLFDTESIAIDKVAKGRAIAPFVAPMVAGKVQHHKGVKTLEFTPAHLKPKDVVDPSRLLTRKAGEGFSGELTPIQRRDAIIADMLLDQDSKNKRRLEWMAAQVLTTGKTIIEGDDYPTSEVDFGRAAENTVTLASSKRWGQAGVSPVDDLEAYAHRAEAPVTKVVMGKDAWKHLRADLKGDNKDLLDSRRGSVSQMELGPSAGYDVSYKGMLGGNMEIWVYTGQYDDAAGNKVNFLKDNQVILGSEAMEGVRAFGAILSPSAGYRAMESFPRHFITQDPEAEYVETRCAPLLIPVRADAVVCVNV